MLQLICLFDLKGGGGGGKRAGRPHNAQQAKSHFAISIVHVKVLKTARDLLHKRTQEAKTLFLKSNIIDILIYHIKRHVLATTF